MDDNQHIYPVGNAAVHHAQQPQAPGGPPSGHHGHGPKPTDIVPQPVVQVLSPRGVEYVFLTIVLLTGAISLISALLALVNGKTGFGVMAFPTSALLVTVPVFAWQFLRLKRAEVMDPGLALDASKRRSTQFIQIIAFITCLFTLIGFIYSIFVKAGGGYNGSLFKVFLDAVVILLVAGGILAYYWLDEHKAR